MKLSVPDHILSIKPYKPGKPLEEVEREYGISNSVKLASNENPLGPSPMAAKAIQAAVGKLNRYPDGSGNVFRNKVAEHLGFTPQNIVLGNGSDEIIGMLTSALLQPGDEVILPRPSFLMYEIMVRSVAATPISVPLKELSIDLDGMLGQITARTRMVFLCNPNNPTGQVVSKKDFENFIEKIPLEVVVVVDEAYIEFVRDQNCARSIEYLDNARPLVMLRTFSKVYGLAGLRIGYGAMPEEIAGVLNRIRQPFNANSLAQIGASAALEDKAFLEKAISLVHHGLDFLYGSLNRLGVKYFPSQANFFLIDVAKDADDIFEDMLRHGVIIRSMKSYGYPRYIRINVGLHEENVRFIKVLERVLE
jgi:histidinol-phosphate aminotransferase